jgi:alkanesulfonate monooxygenase SsuD/methylene tetrahydromethanopterin reductase-like flavin-dependent oxidoreductase (luciferase family)
MEPQLLLDAAVFADRSTAFDSVWVGDNFLSKPRLEAIVTLSAIAALTTHVRLGTICLATFPMRHPIVFALQWASLDLLSGGRTVLAVCNGKSAKDGPLFAHELEALGITSNERVGRLEEGIEILRTLWSREDASHLGRYYSFRGVRLEPRPAQKRIPILIAANPHPSLGAAVEERILRRVARLADGWQTDGVAPHVFRRRWLQIREYAEQEGRAGEVQHSSLHLMVNLNRDSRKARATAVRFLDQYYGAGVVSDEKLSSWLACGPPAAVAEKIAEFMDAGCTTPVLRFVDPDQLGQIDCFVSNVMPLLATAR